MAKVMSVPITVDTSGIRKMAARFKRSQRSYETKMGIAVRDAARVYLKEVEDAAPRSPRTDKGYVFWQKELGGPLADAHGLRHPNSWEWEIVEDTEYGKFVREGNNEARFIGPKFSKMLWWPGLGHPIPYVGTHKSTGVKATEPRSAQKPNPYHEKGAKAAEPKAQIILLARHIEWTASI